MFGQAFRQSIRFRLLGIITGVLIIGGFIASMIVVISENEEHKDTLKTKGYSFASYIAKLSVDPLIMKDDIRLDSLVNEAIKDEDIVYAFILDAGGNIVTSQYAGIDYGSQRMRNILSQLSKEAEFQDIISAIKKKEAVLELSVPVTTGSDVIGKITIGLSEYKIRQQITKTIIFILALNFIIAFALVGLLFVSIKRIILDPIAELAQTAASIARGNFSTQVKVKSVGEVQSLVDSFNHMAEDLKSTTVSKDYMDNIIGSMIDTLIVASPDGNIMRVNKSACELLGYGEEELIGKPVAAIFGELPEYISVDSAPERGYLGNIEKTYRTKDDREIPVLLSVSAMRDKDDSVQGIIYVAVDITERKKSEQQIESHLQKLAALRDIDTAITSSLDIRFNMKVILDETIKQLHVDAADILLFNPHTYTLKYIGGRGFRTRASESAQMRLGEGHAGRAALERHILRIRDISAEKNGFMPSPPPDEEGFVEYLAAPLISKGQVKGVLEIFHRSALNPDRDWMDFLEALGTQSAIAIDNAEMFNDLQRSNIELSLAYDTTLEGWSRALDYRDKETEGHSRRVTEATIKMAGAMGMSDEDLIQVRRGSLLHDIGKLGVPDSILLKPDKLTDEEMEVMKRHPVIAYEILSPISFLRKSIDIPYCHHEKWDGTGYPRGLKGEQIPLAARIFSVVDVFDALRSDRPYRRAWTEEKTIEYIRSLAGVQFDPEVVEKFVGAVGDLNNHYHGRRKE